jgi:hypothetical protein
VLSSHFLPGFAPQVGHRTDRASFFFAVMADTMPPLLANKMVNSDQNSVAFHCILAKGNYTPALVVFLGQSNDWPFQ